MLAQKIEIKAIWHLVQAILLKLFRWSEQDYKQPL